MSLTIATVRTFAEPFGAKVLSKRIVSARTLLAFICGGCGSSYSQRWKEFKRAASGRCQKCAQPQGERHGSFIAFDPQERAARTGTARLESYNRWAPQVIARDGCCVLTGATTDLVAHHLNAWAHFPAQRERIGNGVTLSRTMHRAFHARYGHSCTREDFTEFYREYLSLT